MHATALIPTGLLKVEVEQGPISPSYNDNIIRFGKLGDDSIMRFVSGAKGGVRCVPLESNPDILLGHEMVHALRDRYGLIHKNQLLNDDSVTVPRYANDLDEMSRVIHQLIILVEKDYGIYANGESVDKTFQRTNYICKFKFDEVNLNFTFDLHSQPTGKWGHKVKVIRQKESLLESLTNFEQELSALAIRVSPYSTYGGALDIVRCNLDLLFRLLLNNGNQNSTATDMALVGGSTFKNKLKTLYNQYSQDRVLVRHELIEQLKPSVDVRLHATDTDEHKLVCQDISAIPVTKINQEEIDTVGGNYIRGRSKLDFRCPYSESLLREEHHHRAGSEVLAYTVTGLPHPGSQIRL